MSKTGLELTMKTTNGPIHLKNWQPITSMVKINGVRFGVAPRQTIFLKQGDVAVFNDFHFEVERASNEG